MAQPATQPPPTQSQISPVETTSEPGGLSTALEASPVTASEAPSSPGPSCDSSKKTRPFSPSSPGNASVQDTQRERPKTETECDSNQDEPDALELKSDPG